jgi:predicted ATP-grasp superfamily ATP-dependent carboligase
MYTGALENHPALVDSVSSSRELYGNPGSVLRRVRDPLLVADALGAHGLPCLEVSMSAPSPELQSWLRKPLKSCGGSRIQFTDDGLVPESEGSRAEATGSYFQRFVSGTACSAVYVATGGQSLLLGVTRQLIGDSWTGAAGFQYAGSLGPLTTRKPVSETFHRIGQCLVRRFGLRGLFGVDAMIEGDDVWAVEVNPRYTASVEVIEQALDINALSLHVGACRGGDTPSQSPPNRGRCVGKAIVYAEQHGVVPAAIGDLARQLNADAQWPTIADVPKAGTKVHPRQPVTTVLATGDAVAGVERRLKELVLDVRKALASRS